MPTSEVLAKKLARGTIRTALQRAGMFLTGWELLKADIQDGVREFFVIVPGTVDSRYEQEVLSRHKHPLQASALWLVDQGAISESQCERIDELRKHRNEVAHELAKLLVDPNHEVSLAMLEDMALIIRCVGAFFGRISMDCDPEFDDRDIRAEDIRSGTSVLMDHLVAVCAEIG